MAGQPCEWAAAMRARGKERAAVVIYLTKVIALLCAVITTYPIAATADALPVTAGLLLRLEADAGIQTSGNQVTVWEDQAMSLGGSNNATAAGGSGAAPTFVANGLNGFPTVNFNGSNQFLQIGGNAAFDTDTFTWIIVTQYTRNFASTQTLLNSAYAAGAGTASGGLWGTNIGKGAPSAYAGSASGFAVGTFVVGTDAPVILSAVWSANNRVSPWSNGTMGNDAAARPRFPPGICPPRLGSRATPRLPTLTVTSRRFSSMIARFPQPSGNKWRDSWAANMASRLSLSHRSARFWRLPVRPCWLSGAGHDLVQVRSIPPCLATCLAEVCDLIH